MTAQQWGTLIPAILAFIGAVTAVIQGKTAHRRLDSHDNQLSYLGERVEGAPALDRPNPAPASFAFQAHLPVELGQSPALSAGSEARLNVMTMIDATHVNVGHIPAGTPKVAGYVTGTPDIRWTDQDWNSFPHAGHVHIDQSADQVILYPMVDVETGAATAELAAQIARKRLDRGDGYAGVYASRSRIPAIVAAMGRHGVPLGKVHLWLADWNLSRDEAAALLGTKLDGLTIHAVQWASPTSNPGTIVPGGTLTLREANVDLSVAIPGWHPAPPSRHPALHGYVVYDGDVNDGTGPLIKKVQSFDNGKTWR